VLDDLRAKADVEAPETTVVSLSSRSRLTIY